MSNVLRFVLIAVSCMTLYWILRKIRKSQLKIEDSTFWVIFSNLIFMLSILPELAYIASRVLGIQTVSNFIFLVIIFILLLKVFMMSIKISQLENRFNSLTQEIALESKNTDDLLEIMRVQIALKNECDE